MTLPNYMTLQHVSQSSLRCTICRQVGRKRCANCGLPLAIDQGVIWLSSICSAFRFVPMKPESSCGSWKLFMCCCLLESVDSVRACSTVRCGLGCGCVRCACNVTVQWLPLRNWNVFVYRRRTVSSNCSLMQICTAVLLYRCNTIRTCLRIDWIL
jgi:hypothetical protein